jgi:hypothetical protein
MPQQKTLFDLVTAYGQLFAASGFVSNGIIALPISRYEIDHAGLSVLVERYRSPDKLTPAHVIAELPPVADVPRCLVFAPGDLKPPYTDLDRLYLVDEDLYYLITGGPYLDSENPDVTYRCTREESAQYGLIPIVVVYGRDWRSGEEMLGFCAGLNIDPKKSRRGAGCPGRCAGGDHQAGPGRTRRAGPRTGTGDHLCLSSSPSPTTRPGPTCPTRWSRCEIN